MVNITTVRKLVERHDGLTEGAVRDDIFHADTNGLADFNAIVRKGRRVFVIEERYVEWLLSGVKPRGPYMRKSDRGRVCR